MRGHFTSWRLDLSARRRAPGMVLYSQRGAGLRESDTGLQDLLGNQEALRMTWGWVAKAVLAAVLVTAAPPLGFFVVVIWAIFSKD